MKKFFAGAALGLILGHLATGSTDPVAGSPKVTRSHTATIESLSATDDGTILLGVASSNQRVISVGCRYVSATGAAVLPTIQLRDQGGNVMTHTAPTCVTGNSSMTYQNVTAGNLLVPGEGLTFNVTNIPDGDDTITIQARFVEQ